MIKRQLGGTVNDVVLAAISGGFRAFLLSRGEEPEPHKVPSLIPVSVRAAGEESVYENQVSALVAYLPVHIADPVERRAVRRCAQLRSGRPGRALGEGEHGVRVHVDHARHSAPHFAPGYSPFQAQAVDPMPELPRS